MWNEEGVIKYQNRLKRKYFVATGDIKEMVKELSLSVNGAIDHTALIEEKEERNYLIGNVKN